jgi:hypothetical protein
MSNILSSDLLVRIVVDFILIAVLGAALGYLFDKKLEMLKPLTAAETLRRENYLNSKLQTYYGAIELLCSWMACESWTGPDVPTDRKPQADRPTESEINVCHAKLALFADDPAVLETFKQFFSGGPKHLIPIFGEFINLARKDMGYGQSLISADKYTYIARRG